MSLLATAKQMRELDREAIEDYGIAGAALMESAGAGTVRAILMRWPGTKKALIIAGKGNNGGDGFVIARRLANHRIEAKIILLAKKEDLKGDAAANMKAADKMGIPIHEILDESDLSGCKMTFAHTGLIVDAIFGTGLSSEVKGLPLKAIGMINAAKAPVVSVDIPSGLSADKGLPLPDAVKADITCTYGLAKPGLVQYPGRNFVGELEIVDIGLPAKAVNEKGLQHNLVDLEMAREIYSQIKRKPDAHKGNLGHILVVAGSPGKTGAAALVANAAMRSGAALVSVGVPASLHNILEEKTTEPMTLPLSDGESGYLDSDALKEILSFVDDRGIDVIALGPGIDTQAKTKDLVFALLKEAKIPFVIDADGLNNLASDPKALKSLDTPAIITPHPGEMSKLTGTDTKAIQSDRVGTALNFAMDMNCITVLKGAATVTASNEGDVCINSTGNPGMATGGSGDVLTGIISALVGMNQIPPKHAAALGVFIHGLAGDIAAKSKGEQSLIATDIIDALPKAFSVIK